MHGRNMAATVRRITPTEAVLFFFFQLYLAKLNG
jgi:hypothetical protein